MEEMEEAQPREGSRHVFFPTKEAASEQAASAVMENLSALNISRIEGGVKIIEYDKVSILTNRRLSSVSQNVSNCSFHSELGDNRRNLNGKFH